MKKASKYLAVLLALLMLVSMASVIGVSAAEHITGRIHSEFYESAPALTIPQLTTAPKIDGKIGTNEYGPKQFTMTKDYLKGKGVIWVNVDPNTGVENTPLNVTADVYMAWDSTHFYFAMAVTKPNDHFNDATTNDLLWRGDCLQIQIAESMSANRYELGFAWSTGRKSQLAYQWFPTSENAKLERNKDYTVVLDSSNKKKAVYELAIPVSYFSKKTDLFKKNAKIPFSFALHVYDANDPVYIQDPTGSITPGCFYEWAQGVVGGDMEKQITSAATITLGDPIGTGPTTTTTTTAKPVTTGSTNATKSTTGVGTQPSNVTNAPSSAATTESTTTTAPTTITAPTGDDIALLPIDELVVVEDSTLKGLAEAAYPDQPVELKEIAKLEGKKYAIHQDQLLDMYYLKDDQLEKIPYSDGEEGVRIYDTDTLPSDVEKVYLVVEGEAPVEETTTEATVTATTTQAVTTEAAVTTGTNGEAGGSNMTWLIIVIVAVVVIGGGVGVFFFLKKKQQA